MMQFVLELLAPVIGLAVMVGLLGVGVLSAMAPGLLMGALGRRKKGLE